MPVCVPLNRFVDLITWSIVIMKSIGTSVGTRCSKFMSSGPVTKKTVTLIPGDGIGPEIAAAVQRIFAAAEAPIEWEPVDVTPVKAPDGTMGIPKVAIDSVNRNKVGLKSPLMTPVGKGFRSLNLALRQEFNLYANGVGSSSCHGPQSSFFNFMYSNPG